MKKHSKAKLKGTVLFTVISVMSLLIIFLTSTLVLATSASNRSHKNYASTQTEYTARAAIESFSEAMSRNDAIAQMIVNMKKTDVLVPSVEINDSSLGEIGFYVDTLSPSVDVKKLLSIEDEKDLPVQNNRKWAPGRILIEYIDDTYVYNTKENAWETQQVLKVTATAELAGEESTVSAYIRKKSPDEPKPLSIMGLQSAGDTKFSNGGTFTGGLGIGIEKNIPDKIVLNNDAILKTNMTFINASVEFKTGNFSINVLEKKTGTVIMGDLTVANDEFVNINYEMSEKTIVQKEIPYLYVDGKFNSLSQLSVKDINGKGSPYNIFCGSWDTWGKAVNINNSDLYLMDAGSSNRIGGTSSTKLTSWSSSLIQRGDTQFNSKGGNIYSKGSLKLSQVNIKGNVRVEGDVIIGSDVTIYGDLVVGGKLMIESEENGNIFHPTVNNIYCDNIKSSLPGSSAYKSVNNIYHPATDVRRDDCIKIDNNKYSFYVFYPTEFMEDWSGKKGLFGENVKWYDRVYYYWNSNHDNSLDYDSMSLDELRGYVDGSTGYIPAPMGDSSVPSTYIMQVDVTSIDGEGNLILSETSIITPDEFYYYDPASGAHLSESDLWVHTDEYYTKADFDGNDTGVNAYNEKTYYTIAEPHTEVDEYTATHTEFGYTPPAGTTIHAKSDYSDEIYPQAMTREAILGQSDSGAYKIVTTLEDMQESIGYKGTSFDSSIYLTSVPDNYAEDVSKSYDDPAVKSGGYVEKSCTISGSVNNLVIKPKDTIWIVLEDTSVNGEISVDDGEGGTVNFMIKGNLSLNNGIIRTNNIYAGASVNKSDKININFYGENGSSISYSNDSTICGIAKCPYTTLAHNGTAQGNIEINYSYDGKSTEKIKPHWIGNALFKEVVNTNPNAEGTNRFHLVYTNSGGSGENEINNRTLGESWEIMYYDMY